MSTPYPTLDDQPLSVRAKIAAAWTGAVLVYAYVDILGFYKPGVVDEILVGKVWELDVSQSLMTLFLVLMAIPILMIVLTVVLPAGASRMANLVVASLQIPFAVFNLVGADWTIYYGLGVLLEVSLFVLILRCAWTWPQVATTRGATVRSVRDRQRA